MDKQTLRTAVTNLLRRRQAEPLAPVSAADDQDYQQWLALTHRAKADPTSLTDAERNQLSRLQFYLFDNH
jgi:hypothetical protein